MMNFALIGCGRIGQRHAEIIGNFGRLIAVCDSIKERADSFSSLFGSTSYTDHKLMLQSEKDIDVVVVSSPNGLHAVHTIDSLNSGCHVFCEKPMAISSTDCRLMLNASEKAKKEIVVVKQNRFNPPIVELKKVIDEGRLGSIIDVQLNCFWNRTADYYKDPWRGTLQFDGGTLFTQFSHFIDLLHWMIGDVKSLEARLANYLHKGVIEFEDTGTVLLEFENGAMGTINFTVNSFSKNMEGSITVFGEKGVVKVGGQYLNELEYQAIEDYIIPNLTPGNNPNDYGTYIGSMSNHYKVYENLVQALNSKVPLSANGIDGLKTVDIIERIYQSAKRI